MDFVPRVLYLASDENEIITKSEITHIRSILAKGFRITMIFKDDQYLQYQYAKQHELFTDYYLQSFSGILDEIAASILNKLNLEPKLLQECIVYTLTERMLPVCCKLRELIGLPSFNHDAISNALNKLSTQEILKSGGVKAISTYKISSNADDVDNVIDKLNFPLILKPSNGISSQHVYKVHSRTELLYRIDQMERVLDPDTTFIIVQEYVDMLTYKSIDNDCVVKEFDVDILLQHGVLLYANVVDNWANETVFFQDVAAHAPSILEQDEQRRLIDHCLRCVLLLGFRNGAFHVEAFMTKEGPVVIECNPRVGGGPIVDIHKHVWGVDLLDAYFKLCAGELISDLKYNSRPLSCYGSIQPYAMTTGIVKRPQRIHECITQYGRLYNIEVTCEFLQPPDKLCIGIDTDVPDMIMMVNVKADSTNLIIKHMRELFNIISEIL